MGIRQRHGNVPSCFEPEFDAKRLPGKRGSKRYLAMSRSRSLRFSPGHQMARKTAPRPHRVDTEGTATIECG